jgi:hypothetical protein
MREGRYMRAHGSRPGPTHRPKIAGALSGGLAELAALPVLWYSGAVSSLARSFGVAPALVVELDIAFTALVGALYGQLFGRAANDRRGGWLFGISYGFLTWLLAPVALLQGVMQRPLATGEAATGLLAAQLAWGLAVGLLFPYVHALIQRELKVL